MEKLSKPLASRRAHKSHLTKLKQKIDDKTKDTITDTEIALLRTYVDQLKQKKQTLKDLNNKIIDLLETPEDLEKEILESEELDGLILEKICVPDKLIELTNKDLNHHVSPKSPQMGHENQQPSTSTPQMGQENQQHIPSTSNGATGTAPALSQGPSIIPPAASTGSSENLPLIPPPASTSSSENPPLIPPPASTSSSGNPPIISPPVSTSPSFQSDCLPKLVLPSFNGNALAWQTFWDTFRSAVHDNTSIGDVQKFNYLKAQLRDGAERVIAALPLMNANYAKSVELLEERFAQPHKIINAHTEALLNLPSPTDHLSSLRLFYDAIETHPRGLEALGKTTETYGDKLVPIVIIMAASAELHVLGSNPCGLSCMRGARLRWSHQYHPVGCLGRW